MDNRYDYNSVDREKDLAARADYAQDMTETAEAHLGNVNALDNAVDATNRRTDEYTTKAEAANLSTANDARDAVEGKDWPGRTQAKWSEFGETAKAKGQEVANNVQETLHDTESKRAYDTHDSLVTDPTLREKQARKDEDFGDKVKDAATDAGEKIHEGFDKVKGWFGKDDEEPRVH